MGIFQILGIGAAVIAVVLFVEEMRLSDLRGDLKEERAVSARCIEQKAAVATAHEICVGDLKRVTDDKAAAEKRAADATVELAAARKKSTAKTTEIINAPKTGDRSIGSVLRDLNLRLRPDQ